MNDLSILEHQKSAMKPETKPWQTHQRALFSKLCLGRMSMFMFASENPSRGETESPGKAQHELWVAHPIERVNFNTNTNQFPEHIPT